MARNTGRGTTWGGQYPTGPTDDPRSYRGPTQPTWGTPMPTIPAPAAGGADPRHDLREQIVALLREHNVWWADDARGPADALLAGPLAPLLAERDELRGEVERLVDLGWQWGRERDAARAALDHRVRALADEFRPMPRLVGSYAAERLDKALDGHA